MLKNQRRKINGFGLYLTPNKGATVYFEAKSSSVCRNKTEGGRSLKKIHKWETTKFTFYKVAWIFGFQNPLCFFVLFFACNLCFKIFYTSPPKLVRFWVSNFILFYYLEWGGLKTKTNAVRTFGWISVLVFFFLSNVLFNLN